MKVALVDYGAGNLKSIANAVKKCGDKTVLASTPGKLKGSDAIILPGVGSFALVRKIAGLKKEMARQIDAGTPFLGICLGMQMLFKESEEAPGARGMGILHGRVARLPSRVKIPHIGWNQVKSTPGSRLFKGAKQGSFFYFDHSYAVQVGDAGLVAGVTDYGREFVSAVERGSLFGVQFHPEKSGDNGLRVMKNFLACSRA